MFVQMVQGRKLGFTFFYTAGTRLYVPLAADPPGSLQLQIAFQKTREKYCTTRLIGIDDLRQIGGPPIELHIHQMLFRAKKSRTNAPISAVSVSAAK